MREFKFGIEILVISFIASICSIILLCIISQNEHINKACEAISINDQYVAKTHIDRVWDIDSYGSKKETMLMVACKCGNAEIIDYLLERGADVNYTVKGKLTPLELLSRDGYKAGEKAFRAMLSAGAIQSIYTEKPAVFHLAENFHWMQEEDKLIVTESVIALLQYGAPLIYNNTSILHLAAKGNMSDLFYTIIHTSKGINVINMKNNDGETPWEIAVKNGSIDVQKVIRNFEYEYGYGKEEESSPFGNDEIYVENKYEQVPEVDDNNENNSSENIFINE